MYRPPIAVCRGGFSGESAISMQSAARMLAAVDTERFAPFYVSITPQGWSCSDAQELELPFDRGNFAVDRGMGPERFAAALIAIHGSPGEDGPLQGYLDLLGVPYQTGGVLNMALTFSKYATTALLRQLGFPVAPSILVHRSMPDALARAASVGYPCFVKPDRSGSSLGVSKVKESGQLAAALEAAFAECTAVMVEGAVSGRELTCGVIVTGQQAKPLPVCEIRTPREFFDYEAKYHASDTQEIVPAPLPDAVTRLVQERSAAICQALDCRGLLRVDHFWTGTELVTIEINTVPGFSAASIFPKMLEVEGMAIDELVNSLVEHLVSQTRQPADK